MPTEGEQPNGRITWREVYQLIEKQNELRQQMEQRIMRKLESLACVDDVARLEGRTNDLDDEMDELKKNVYTWSGVNSTLALVGSVIAGWFGARQ
jgi:predicted S18 family serine protease